MKLNRRAVRKVFLLSWKKLGLTVLSFITVSILHNLISALLNTEEGFFFIIAALIIPVYLIIAVVYTAFNFVSNKKNHHSKSE